MIAGCLMFLRRSAPVAIFLFSIAYIRGYKKKKKKKNNMLQKKKKDFKRKKKQKIDLKPN